MFLISQQIHVVRSACTESSCRIHSYFVLKARGQNVQKNGKFFCCSPASFTPLNFERVYGDSFQATRLRPRLRSRPKEETLLLLPFDDIV
jgi:hypothetical protein